MRTSRKNTPSRTRACIIAAPTGNPPSDNTATTPHTCIGKGTCGTANDLWGRAALHTATHIRCPYAGRHNAGHPLQPSHACTAPHPSCLTRPDWAASTQGPASRRAVNYVRATGLPAHRWWALTHTARLSGQQSHRSQATIQTCIKEKCTFALATKQLPNVHDHHR